MEKIHILTDSSSDIPHDLVEAHGIEIVPIMLTHEGRSFREYYDITSEDYCRLLETSSEIPGTAMTTPTVFLESYNRAFERGCTHLLAVLINGGKQAHLSRRRACKSMFGEEQGEGKMTIEGHRLKTYTYVYGHGICQGCRKCASRLSFDAIVNVVNRVALRGGSLPPGVARNLRFLQGQPYFGWRSASRWVGRSVCHHYCV